MLRQSLKTMIENEELPPLNSKWATKRPEELLPEQFIELTHELLGCRSDSSSGTDAAADGKDFHYERIWRNLKKL
jgi:hypothetical protein